MRKGAIARPRTRISSTTFSGRAFGAPYRTAKDYEPRAAMKRKPISVIGLVAPGSTVTIARLAKVSRAKCVSRVKGRADIMLACTGMNIAQLENTAKDIDRYETPMNVCRVQFFSHTELPNYSSILFSPSR